MNRLIRIILYITAGCVGIGCAALILSFALGGGRLAWEEDNVFRQARDTAREIAANTAEQVQGRLAQQDACEEDDDEISYAEEDVEDLCFEEDIGDGLLTADFIGDEGLLAADASSIHDLSIDLQHGYLSVMESDDDIIRVSVGKSTGGITAECESGRIAIKDSRTGKQSRKDAYVYLEIPYGMQFKNVRMQINAGSMENTECGFTAEKLTINADAGEICISEVEADVLSASVGAGAIDIEDGVFQTASLDCGVGVMDIEADIRGDAKVDCGMGTVDLELAAGADSVNYVLHCGAGSIEIGDNTYSGLAKESRLNNGAAATFTLNCGMGVICID